MCVSWVLGRTYNNNSISTLILYRVVHFAQTTFKTILTVLLLGGSASTALGGTYLSIGILGTVIACCLTCLLAFWEPVLLIENMCSYICKNFYWPTKLLVVHSHCECLEWKSTYSAHTHAHRSIRAGKQNDTPSRRGRMHRKYRFSAHARKAHLTTSLPHTGRARLQHTHRTIYYKSYTPCWP